MRQYIAKREENLFYHRLLHQKPFCGPDSNMIRSNNDTIKNPNKELSLKLGFVVTCVQ